ncbi:MAG: SdpI family protein [Flavobacteriales bacterium]
MEFNAMGFLPLNCGIIFIIAGFILLKRPPKKINYLYGYRTNRSMRDQQSWDFAQIYSGRKMIQYGFLLALSSLSAFFLHPEETSGVFIGLGLMICAVVLIIMNVEQALKKKFGDA